VCGCMCVCVHGEGHISMEECLHRKLGEGCTQE